MNSKLIELPKISDSRGSLSFVESNDTIPFKIKRVFYMYEIPAGSTRGHHAHINAEQFVIAMHGVLNITLDDGKAVETYSLSAPDVGLYVAPMTWVNINTEGNAVCAVMTSEHYDESDYIRDYDKFLRMLT